MTGLITIVLFIALLLLWYCYAYHDKNSHVDNFINSILLITDKYRQNIVIHHGDYDKSLNDFVRLLPTKYRIIVDKQPSSMDIIHLDAVSFNEKHYKDDHYLLTVSDDTRKVLFIRDTEAIQYDTLQDAVRLNARVGYINDTVDIFIIRALCAASDLKVEDLKLKKLESFAEATQALFLDRTIDVLFIYANTKHPEFITTFEQQKLGICSFDRVDIAKLHFFLPYAIIKDINWKQHFQKYLDRQSVKKTLEFNYILCMKSPMKVYLLEYLVKYFKRNDTYLNVFSQTSRLHPIHHPKSEHFRDESNVKLAPRKNIKGYYLSSSSSFIYADTLLEQVPLSKDDIIVLAYQDRPIENGVYRVIRVEAGRVEMKKQRKTDDYKDQQGKYVCFTDPTIRHKGLCESSFDVIGKPKVKGVWDKPCETDNECPFFQKNTNYLNYRGGCQNGYCEFPLGVVRTGFKSYTQKPYCHGCPDKLDPMCCDEQEQPDFAFPLDDYERLPKLVETFESDFVPGNFTEPTFPTVYYNEVSNEIINVQLYSIMNTEHTEKHSQPDMKSVLDGFLLKNKFFKEYGVYDLNIVDKDISVSDGINVVYTIEFTLYRLEKSHGKRVRIQLKHDTETGTFTTLTGEVIGVLAEERVTVRPIPKGLNVQEKADLKHSQIRCRTKTFREILGKDSLQDYICKQAKKMKNEYNIVNAECEKQETNLF